MAGSRHAFRLNFEAGSGLARCGFGVAPTEGAETAWGSGALAGGRPPHTGYRTSRRGQEIRARVPAISEVSRR